jgi:hypothetical protein
LLWADFSNRISFIFFSPSLKIKGYHHKSRHQIKGHQYFFSTTWRFFRLWMDKKVAYKSNNQQQALLTQIEGFEGI